VGYWQQKTPSLARDGVVLGGGCYAAMLTVCATATRPGRRLAQATSLCESCELSEVFHGSFAVGAMRFLRGVEVTEKIPFAFILYIRTPLLLA